MIEIKAIQNTKVGKACNCSVVWLDEEGKLYGANTKKICLPTCLAVKDIGKIGKATNIFYENSQECGIIVIGLGRLDKLTSNKLRNLAATAIKEAIKLNQSSIAITLPKLNVLKLDNIAMAIAEGLVLGSYSFDYYKTSKDVSQQPAISLIYEDNEFNDNQLQTIINEAVILSESVNFTRNLVNHPSKYMTPTKMSEHAEQIAKENGLTYIAMDKPEIIANNMHAMLAVAQGSAEPAKFIHLEYIGNKNSSEKIALIGKGITFDSGGISLKPSQGMEEMKDDMAGGAAVLGAIRAIAALKLPINIMAIIPCTENMPSGHALKPGDVISSMNGKTIEIISTDAEGRLILIDAITYAIKLGATKLIDIATLTGACVVALGTTVSGVITNNQAWCSQLLGAAEQSGERMWQLPNDEEYLDLIKSNIADLKNSGGRYAGAITAGLFIQEFAGDMPWIHIDIAGTANSEKDNGYNRKGATGVGVRTLVQLCRNLA